MRGVLLVFIHSSAVGAATLELSGSDSSIYMNNAVLRASCGETASVSWMGPLGADVMSGDSVTVEFNGVAISCVGRNIATEPCARHSVLIPPLFFCVWSGSLGHHAGPAQAAQRTQVTDGGIHIDWAVHINCTWPEHNVLADLFPATMTMSTANLSLSVRYVDPDTAAATIPFKGLPGGDVVPFILSAPPPPPLPPVWSGGESIVANIGGKAEQLLIFDAKTSPHTFSLSKDIVFKSVLVVGGGGGCGFSEYINGGGGAGGIVVGTDVEVKAGTYTITVATGGKGATAIYGTPSNGGDSSAFGHTAKGGGRAGIYNTNQRTGAEGGSGGGGAAEGSTVSPGSGGSSSQDKYSSETGWTGYGSSGGQGQQETGTYSGVYRSHWGGGGGGAGGNGMTGPSGGAGGSGIDLSAVFGSSVGEGGWFGGGGAGSAHRCTGCNVPSDGTPCECVSHGGKGGGGDGSSGQASPGQDGTGGGCGGSERAYAHGSGTASHGWAGTSGGSGVVIIKF